MAEQTELQKKLALAAEQERAKREADAASKASSEAAGQKAITAAGGIPKGAITMPSVGAGGVLSGANATRDGAQGSRFIRTGAQGIQAAPQRENFNNPNLSDSVNEQMYQAALNAYNQYGTTGELFVGGNYSDKTTNAVGSERSSSGNILQVDELGRPVAAKGLLGINLVSGVDASKTVQADSEEGRRILAGHEAFKRGELDAYMTEAGGKVNKQITPAMVEAAQALAKQSLGRFRDKNSPLSADVLKPTLNRQDALMQQMQAARKKESIAQLQAATSMGRNVQQAGVNAGRGALSSRAALAQLAGQQSQAAGAQGAGVLQEQMNARQAMQGLSNQMRGSGDAAVKASQQAMLQQRQNALANYAARSQAGASAQQSRKQLEVNNLMRAYKMAEGDATKQADILTKIAGAIGTGAQIIGSIFG